MKIAISAESTIDLPKNLLAQYEIHTIPFTLVMGETQGPDGEIQPADLFAYTEKTGQLARTSAINEFQYEEYFQALRKEYDYVIHFSLSSKISSACANAKSVAKNMENVHIVDSLSLSTGIALQAIYASRLVKAGKSYEEIIEAVEKRVPFTQASFSLESVNFLYKGGRCSALKMLAANILKLKPEIYVKDGAMGPGAKYRGPMIKVVEQYIDDTLKDYHDFDNEIAFVTYSTAPDDVVALAKAKLEKAGFKTVYTTTAGGTISCHCGPHCLGVLYFNDGPHPVE